MRRKHPELAIRQDAAAQNAAAEAATAAPPGGQQLALAPELAPPPPRPLGRPPGSANRQTALLLERIDAMGPRPVEQMNAVLLRGYEALAAELGVNRQTALELWVKLGGMLLPYTSPTLSAVKVDAEPGSGGGIAALLHLSALQGMNLAALAAETVPNGSFGTLSEPLDFIDEIEEEPTSNPDPERSRND